MKPKSKKEQAIDLLDSKPALNKAQLDAVETLKVGVDFDVPEVLARLSPDVETSPTLQDLLLLISASEYRTLMPKNYMVEDDMFPGQGVTRVPSLTEFFGKVKLLGKEGVGEDEADAEEWSADEKDADELSEDKIRLLLEIAAVEDVRLTLPDTIYFIDTLRSNGPISRDDLKDLIGMLEKARDVSAAAAILINDAGEGNLWEHTNTGAAAQEALRIGAAILSFAHGGVEGGDKISLKDFNEGVGKLKPDYMTPKEFATIVDAARKIHYELSSPANTTYADFTREISKIERQEGVIEDVVAASAFSATPEQLRAGFEEAGGFERGLVGLKDVHQIAIKGVHEIAKKLGISITGADHGK